MNLLKKHHEDIDIIESMVEVLKKEIDEDTIIVCIGTDRCIGDAVGPIVGSMLKNKIKNVVYGTINEPIHALNIFEYAEMINKKHKDTKILCIDAALGKRESIGKILIDNKPMSPGKGVGKKLPTIGNISIKPVVANYKENAYDKLRNVRLSYVIKISEIITQSIKEAIEC